MKGPEATGDTVTSMASLASLGKRWGGGGERERVMIRIVSGRTMMMTEPSQLSSLEFFDFFSDRKKERINERKKERKKKK